MILATNTRPDNYLTHTRGIASWIFTLDHKRIGVMYLVVDPHGLVPGRRVRHAHPPAVARPHGAALPQSCRDDPQIIFKTYNQIFTMHGAIMVFVVLIPASRRALGNFVLPIMLGAKDVAFPRLNLASYYFYVFGASSCWRLSSLVVGGVDTGWTFYTPYSVQTSHAGDLRRLRRLLCWGSVRSSPG